MSRPTFLGGGVPYSSKKLIPKYSGVGTQKKMGFAEFNIDETRAMVMLPYGFFYPGWYVRVNRFFSICASANTNTKWDMGIIFSGWRLSSGYNFFGQEHDLLFTKSSTKSQPKSYTLQRFRWDMIKTCCITLHNTSPFSSPNRTLCWWLLFGFFKATRQEG